MAELESNARLSTLEHRQPEGATARFIGTSRDIFTRQGPRLSMDLDRVSWEALGRPVDVTVTIESGHTTPTLDVIREVAVERTLQEANGYDAQHDDDHGIQHLMDQAQRRLAGKLWSRDDLIEAAALLVASVEWMDRATGTAPSVNWDTAGERFAPITPITNTQGPQEDLSNPQRL